MDSVFNGLNVIPRPAVSCDFIPQAGLVASYKFTGTAEDALGIYDGTEGTITYAYDSERGVVPSAASSYFDLGTPNLMPHDGDYSVSHWLKRTGGIRQYLANRMNAATPYGDSIYWESDNTIRVGFATASNSQVLGSTSALSSYDGLWVNVTVTVDRTAQTAKLYVNGSEVSLSAITVPTTSYNNSLNVRLIGRYDSYYSATISNCNFYNRALTSTEALQIYNTEYQIHNIPIDNGLIAYYPLHGNSLDNALNQYDGTDTSVTYAYDSALAVTVGVFNGASSKISLPTALTPSADSMSVSYWVKTSLSDANLRSAVDGSVTSSGEWVTYFINGKLRLAYYGIDGSSTIDGTATISDGNWHLVTEVLDNTNGTLKVYIDTVEEISYSFTPAVTLYQFSGTSYIGSTNGTTEFFYGSISNVRIYNRVLSTTEMGVIHYYDRGLLCLENAQNI